MALSGSFTHSIKTGYRLVVEWSATQSISNNTSTVTVELYLESLSSGYTIASSTNKTAWIEIDGNRSTNNSTNVTLSGNQKKLMHSSTRTLSHASDGSKSFTIRASQEFGFSFAGSYTGTVTTSTRTYTLDTIPRSSTISNISATYVRSNASDPSNDITFTINRASTAFRHRVSLYRGSTFIQSWGDNLTGGSMTVSLSQTGVNRCLDQMPNVTSRLFEFRVRTFDGSGNRVGSDSSTNRTMWVSNVETPNIGAFTVAEGNSTVINSPISVYVQGISLVRTSTGSLSAPRGASLTRMTISYAGFSATINNPSAPTRAWTPNRTGTQTSTVVLEDSRGRTHTRSSSHTVYAYSSPAIDTFTANRSDSAGVAQEDGTFVNVVRATSISSLNGQNRNRFRILSRPRNGAWEQKVAWSSWITNINNNNILSTYDKTTSYEIMFEVEDYITTGITAIRIIPTEEVTMSWGKEGLGVGKIWERGALDIRGNGHFTGTLTFENVSGTGIGESGEALRIGDNREMSLSLWSGAGVVYLNRDTTSGYYLRFRSHHSASNFGTDFGIRTSDRYGVFFNGLEVNGPTSVGNFNAELIDTTSSIRTTNNNGIAVESVQYDTYAGVFTTGVNDFVSLYTDLSKVSNGFRIRSHTGGSSYNTNFEVSGSRALFYDDVLMTGVRDNTVTWTGRVAIGASSGRLGHVTSSRRYKLAIEEAKSNPYALLDIKPKTWFDKNNTERYADELTRKYNGEEVEGTTEMIERVPGLIAEEVHEAGLSEYVNYAQDGTIMGVDYDRLWTLLIPVVKEQKEKIGILENEVKILKELAK